MSHLPLNNQVTGQPANDAGYAALMAVKPGERLSKARKQQKLDIDAVAGQLNLSVSVLRSLEADDYSALPSSTFVKGYIRNYARLLRLPDTELVKAFEHQTGLHSSMDEQHPVPRARSKVAAKRVGAILMVLILLLIVIGWWVLGEQKPVDKPVAEQVVDTAVAASVSPPVAEPEFIPEPSVVPELAGTPEPNVAPESNAVPESNVAGSEAAYEPAVPELEITGAEADTLEPQVPEADSPAPEKGELVMRFSDDCWVEIRDSNGRLIHARLYQAGARHTAQYAVPYDVKLGNGNAVEVFYNGSQIRYVPSKQSNVARFTIGDES